MSGNSQIPPPGWHVDEETGAWVRDVIHRMGRRCRNWDYCGKGAYQITITLADRRSRALGRLDYAEGRGAFVELSELGRLVEGVFDELPRQWAGVEVLGVQIMPDHLHVVLAVRSRQRKPLGAIVGSFKSKATSRWLDRLGRTRPSATGESCASARVPKLWAEGYVDTILFDESAVANALAYLADNPRRLWEKRAHPELFTVLRDLSVDLGQGRIGHFAAIGNHYLLKAHSILQVQCSRRFFAYARDAKGVIQKGLPPRIESDEFRAAAEALLEEAAHGAVLISPCVSEGEREIARQAFVAGHKVITLANKGFSPLYKPGGRLFDHCAAGNLLMLAPVGWPYLPGEKKMTRLDACVLNRLAQLVSGPGAVDVVYKGIAPEHVDDLARRAVAG